MIDFLCMLWPYLAGGLIGWLLAGWLARRFKHAEPPVEKIVEKVVEKKVDNPSHLMRISELESQVSNYKSTSNVAPVAAMSTTPIKRTTPTRNVTRTIDNPEHLKRISELESQLESEKKSARAAAQVVPVTKTVDNPEHLKRISELESQVSLLQKDSQVGSAGVSNISSSAHSTQTSNTARSSVSSSASATTIVDLAAAKASGFNVKMVSGKDDLTVVEGIGPKICELIYDADIHTFNALGNSKVETIQKILDDAGSRYSFAEPGTWPAQAEMAANNRWEALKAWQDELDGGK